MSKKKDLTSIFLRLSKAEKSAIERAAKRQKISMNQYIRQILQNQPSAREEEKKELHLKLETIVSRKPKKCLCGNLLSEEICSICGLWYDLINTS